MSWICTLEAVIVQILNYTYLQFQWIGVRLQMQYTDTFQAGQIKSFFLHPKKEGKNV